MLYMCTIADLSSLEFKLSKDKILDGLDTWGNKKNGPKDERLNLTLQNS
jgi:hypothetical protein